MATTLSATGAQDHRFLVAALLALGGVTGVAFGRVFQGRPATLRLVLAGVLAVALAEVLRRRNILVSVLGSAAGLLAVLGLAVFPGTTWFALPTLDTLAALGEAIGGLGRQAAREVAPAPALPSLMTASMTAVWAASAAAHALAVRSRSTILPVLPPAALLAFAGVVTGDGPRPGYAAAVLLASAAVVLGVGAQRLGSWGRIVQRTARSRRRLLGATTLRSAGWIGVTALLVALLLPGALPGYGAGALVDFGGGGGGSVAISPIVDIRPSLRQNPPARLFMVQADRPAYWRMVALDRFDGLVWTAGDLYAEEGAEVVGSQTLAASPAPGELMTQRIQIDELATSWLPAAFEPHQVVAEGELRYSALSGMLVRPDGVTDGFSYEVTSKLVTPDASHLDAAQVPATPSLEPFLQLPPDLPAGIREEAERIIAEAGAVTPYQKALAIQEYLRTFTYDAAIPQGHANRDLLDFLLRTRRGYCEQFAGAMAVMLRTLGIPTRVAVGFREGVELAPGTFQVSSQDAHAWPEVFFGNFGWQPFEPTPTRSNPVGEHLESGGRRPQQDGGPGGAGAQGEPGRGLAQRSRFATSAATEAREAPGKLPRIRVPRPEPEFPWGRVVLGVLAGAAVLALLVAIGKATARRLALRRQGEGVARRAYRVVEATAADLGLGRRPTETLGEYRNRLRSTVAFSDGHLDRLTDLTALSMYGARDLTGPEDRDAVAAARVIDRDLRRHAGPLRRALGAIRPVWPY